MKLQSTTEHNCQCISTNTANVYEMSPPYPNLITILYLGVLSEMHIHTIDTAVTQQVFHAHLSACLTH